MDDNEFYESVAKTFLFSIQVDELKVYEIGDVIDLILKQSPNIQIVNLGESDFIIEREKENKNFPLFEYCKLVLVCGIVFFGSGFSVITFNEDACIPKILDQLYVSVIGQKKEGGSIMEIAYSIGITLGILVFYNHIFRRKKLKDPTPIQVEMKQFEKQINETVIINKEREGPT